MDVMELRERIARWEDLHTDFKESVGSPNELAKDIVCFANTDGGQIIVGVAEDRTIVGVEDPDAVHRLVDNVAFHNCEPPITVVQETVAVEGRTVVAINVPKGSQRPATTSARPRDAGTPRGRSCCASSRRWRASTSTRPPCRA